MFLYYEMHSTWRFIMHNLVSFNQLAGFKLQDSELETSDNLINEYYECLVECDDNQSVCKRICREVLV